MTPLHHPTRRHVLAAACAMSLGGAACAQSDFPNKPIRIVVPYSPGTGSDALARSVAQGITEKSGKQVLIENRDGGGSLIGTQAVVKAAPDGYTLLMAANPMVIVPSQSASPPYDPDKDFVPVAKLAVIPLVLAVTPGLKINNVKELIAYARAHPGKLSYGSSGPGTISQQQMELFNQAAGVDIPEIPYKSTSQAMTDLIGGTLSLFPVVVPLVVQHLLSGRAKGLAVFDTARSALLPDLPAITEEISVAGYVPTPVWYGLVAPAKTPRDVVAVLSGLIQNAMDTPEAKARLSAMGAQRINVSNEQFSADIRNEYEKAGALARKLGTFK